MSCCTNFALFWLYKFSYLYKEQFVFGFLKSTTIWIKSSCDLVWGKARDIIDVYVFFFKIVHLIDVLDLSTISISISLRSFNYIILSSVGCLTTIMFSIALNNAFSGMPSFITAGSNLKLNPTFFNTIHCFVFFLNWLLRKSCYYATTSNCYFWNFVRHIFVSSELEMFRLPIINFLQAHRFSVLV